MFAYVVLADEINRASSRTQSALLEAMGKGQVTVDSQTYPLAQPFWVVATQNEVDPFGIFPLPHAQLDRFLMSLSIGYPSHEEQVAILDRSESGEPVPSAVLTPQEVCHMQNQVQQVMVARPVKEYVARILAATRQHPEIVRGDKAVAAAVLAHRLILTPSSVTGMSPQGVVSSVLDQVPVPM